MPEPIGSAPTKNVLKSKTIQGVIVNTIPTIYAGIEMVKRMVNADDPLKESEAVMVPLVVVAFGVCGAAYAIYGRLKAKKGLTAGTGNGVPVATRSAPLWAICLLTGGLVFGLGGCETLAPVEGRGVHPDVTKDLDDAERDTREDAAATKTDPVTRETLDAYGRSLQAHAEFYRRLKEWSVGDLGQPLPQ